MVEPIQTNGSLLAKAEAAFQKVVEKVVERARQTRTPIVVWKDDHVTELLCEQITENRKPKTENHD
jgi:hypothetical protein